MQKGTMLGIIALVVVVSYIGYNEFSTQIATAQIAGEHRFAFAKDFEDYLQVNSIDYSASLPPQLSIFHWDTLPTNIKNGIIVRANQAGYQEITP